MSKAKVYLLPQYQKNQKRERKPRRLNIKKLAIILVSLIVLFSLYRLFRYQSLMLKSLKVQQSELEQKVEAVKGDIEELKNEQLLLDSLEYIEEVARKEYGMVAPGEKIFVPVKTTP